MPGNRLTGVLGRPRPTLICYFPLGDPALTVDPAWYAEAGVDVLEIGVPAADPVLDGPVMRASMSRARAAGTTNAQAAEAIRQLRSELPEVAAVWMTYLDATGPEFADDLRTSESDGVLVADLGATELAVPPSVTPIPLLSHHPDADEIGRAVTAQGYLMLAANAGVTGARSGLDPANADTIGQLRAAGVTAPIALGFGIADGPTARAAIAAGADGVVVGSAILSSAERSDSDVRRLLKELRHALDD